MTTIKVRSPGRKPKPLPVPTREDRQWGHFVVYEDFGTHKLKKLVVEPGKSLSYQRHELRDEWWFVVSGSGKLRRGEDFLIPLFAGESVHRIVKGDWHQLINDGLVPLIVIEVQVGKRCIEEDIERRLV